MASKIRNLTYEQLPNLLIPTISITIFYSTICIKKKQKTIIKNFNILFQKFSNQLLETPYYNNKRKRILKIPRRFKTHN